MKEVIAVIRMNMMNRTKKALQDAGVVAFFAHEAYGRGKGLVDLNPWRAPRRGSRRPWPCSARRASSTPSAC